MEEYKCLQNNGKTQVRFNYLGHFDNEAENELFSYSGINTGSDVGMENEMSAVLDINCMIVKQSLIVEISYNNKAMAEDRMKGFAEDYIRGLELIIDHASQIEEVHFTPSDFSTVDLKQEDLDILFD
jgi:surfactin family lipopeptide synthetase A